MQTAFLYLGAFGLALSLPVLAAAWLYRQDSHPLLDAASRLRRLPRIVQLALLAFVAQLIVYGSTKTNSPSALPPGPLANPPLPLMGDGPATVSGFTPEQLAAGFVLAHVDPAAGFDFAPPDGVAPVARWLLRGAADDVVAGPSFGPLSDAPAVFADGRLQDCVRDPSAVYAPLLSSLGVVPAANWGLVSATNAQSMVWCATTASNSLVVTWRDVLLGRDTNMPVGVQAEIFDDGSFAYRYDLRNVKCRIESGELEVASLSNVIVGASLGGQPQTATLYEVATNAAFSVFSSPFSISYVALDADDALVGDRDADGLSTFDEIFVHRTDPGLPDSDGDGIPDGEEVAQSLDPLSVSVSNEVLLARLDGFQTNMEYAAAYVAATNELVGYRLWDGFAAAWPAGATNLVYERTVRIDRQQGWQQYYLSSKPDAAGGWSLGGLVLEWEDSDGESGVATASPAGDSMYLPLSTNGPSSVTFRLRATAANLRSARPVYLVGYAPKVSISGGSEHTTASGDELAVFMDGSESEIWLSVDRSRRPCRAALYPRERIMSGIADLEHLTGGGLRYEGGIDGGRIFASGAGVYPVPDSTVCGVLQSPVPMRGALPSGAGRYLVVLMPWVKYGEHVCGDAGLGWDGANYVVEYEYPLDSGCLVREWRRDAGGAWNCDCAPSAGCGLGDDNGFVSVGLSVDGDTATASVMVGDETLWTGRAVHVRDPGCTGSFGIEPVGDDCGECESGCADGDCSGLEGPSMGSLRFRVPTGMPRKGQVAGFAYFTTETPTMVTPASFKYLLRGDVGASVSTNGGTRVVSCTCERGRRLVIEAIPNGTRVTVNAQATGALEHTWEIVNVGGSANEIRLRQISRLGNVMQDWTYEYAYNEDSGKWDWHATDNIAGVREELEKADAINEDGSVSETRTKYDLDGNWLGTVETRSEIVGERECGVLREVYRREVTANNAVVRTADYWRDTAHPARNGRLRLLLADDAPWEYHEWNEDGFEVLRVEQRNGSAAPAVFPSATSNGFENASHLADAFLTTYSYAPPEGDDAHSDDYGKARCESRYVVRGGVATLTGRTWRRYTHVYADWRPAVREETWRAHSASAQFGDAANAYSWRTVFDPVVQSEDVPLVLRGETAEEMDEGGVLTTCSASVSGGRVALTRRRWRGGMQFPTYDVVEVDDTYGLVLRDAKCLTDGGAVVDETLSVYDDQSRLRSATYRDGTTATNSYSCCRLLWSRDREGRRTLRSALTGQDGLYYAEEDVWLADVSTNGRYRVTQHFLDGLGRETNVVVYVGSTPGEATDLSVSDGRRLSEERTQYARAGYDAVDSVDVRGKYESRRTSLHADREVSIVDTYAGESAPGPTTHVVETDVRNGPGTTRREWDGKWTERRTWSDYGADGCRADYVATASSDCGTVTNSVTWHDFLGRRVVSEGPSGTETTAYDGSTPRAVSTTVAAGDVVRTTENVYDGLGELVGSVRDGVSSVREEKYEQSSNEWWKVVRTVVSAGGETNSVSETRERVTGLSDAVRSQVVRISPDGVATETTASYDPATDLTVETTTSPVDGTVVRTLRHGLVLSIATPSGTTEYAYDELGRVVRETCGAAVAETEYSPAGDVAARRTRTGEASYAEETYAYDSFGNRVAETNALGCATETAYDADGNAVEVSGAATYPVRFAYDTEGRRTLLSTTRDGTIWDVTTWEYDPATGRRLAKQHADGSRYATTYTPDGLESVVTRPSLQWKENVYDAKRQLVGVVSNDGSENAAFEYDDFGRMTAASNAASYTASMLHRNGTATNEVVSVGTNSFEIGRTVDMFGRQDGRGVAGREFQWISYDGIGRVGSITGQTAVVTYAYSEDGMDAGYAVSLAAGANVVRHVSRDTYRPGLVTSVSNIVNGVAVLGFGYQHDAAGRVLSRNGDTFAYNERGEIVFSRRGAENAEEDSYAYDQIGNFTSTICGGVTNVYFANELNQYESVDSVAVSFTSDGGIVADGLLQFAYDSAGRLSTVSTGGVAIATFQYDALGRRVRKTTQGATHTYVYDGWNLVLERIERDGGETDTVEYFWGKDMSGSLGGAGGIGGLLYLKHNGAAFVPLYDANGNVMQYVDATGAVVASYVYDAFGRTLASAGTHAELFRFRFSTKYHDPESGLVYYGYRFYSPNLARWLTRDPLEEQGGLNLYAFCANDAIGQVDPYGLIMRVVDPTMYPFPIIAKLESTLFWLSVADLYFRAYENCPISADMLNLSIFGNFDFGTHIFPEGGQLANAIKNSPEYNAIIRDLVANQNLGRSSYDEHKSTKFNSKDLKTAVGHSDYELTGDICKLKNGSARLNLRMKVLDTYNFEWWGYEKVKIEGFWLTAGNNLAWCGQMFGDLKTYPWSVSFYDNRKWIWRGKSETRLAR